MKGKVQIVVLILFSSFSTFGQTNQLNQVNAKHQPAEILQEPIILGVGDTWAVVAWTTNESGKVNSRIYAAHDVKSLKPVSQTLADPDSSAITSYEQQQYPHLVRVNNLQPGTTYYFRADSGNENDHNTLSRSNVWSSTTRTRESQSDATTTELIVSLTIPAVGHPRTAQNKSLSKTFTRDPKARRSIVGRLNQPPYPSAEVFRRAAVPAGSSSGERTARSALLP